jgi:hypothetical protein
MSDVQFTLNSKVSNGTSNISYLLNETHIQYLRTLTPNRLTELFGPGEDVDIPSKGYTDPEWYWAASDGNVWGLGWRWGEPRLRGRGGGTGAARVHPNKLTAYEFVEFIRESFEQ